MLQNVTYKDKKFWFEISGGPKGSGTQTYNFHAACTREAMNIWQMAKDQHSFFKKKKNQVRCLCVCPCCAILNKTSMYYSTV